MKENFSIVKNDHIQSASPGFQMGMHRWEAILDALKPTVEEFIMLSKIQNKVHAALFDPGSELSIDDGIIPYHLGYDSKLRAAHGRRSAPIKHCPTKPHPYGFLTHQLISKVRQQSFPTFTSTFSGQMQPHLY
jgi:hypothetical protein